MRLQHSQGDRFKIMHDSELQATACQAAVRLDAAHACCLLLGHATSTFIWGTPE